MSFGQLVIGPPGAGKSSYCAAMHAQLSAMGRRVCAVNLDPANDARPYPADIDVQELIRMDEVMDTFQLGPNGGLMYCMEYLEKNLKWLKKRIEEHKGCYFLFDLPGQVELYTHHASTKRIVQTMTEKWGMKLTCVNLIDSHHCSDPSKFLSVLLLSLNSMVQLELPHVNVLSKMDLMEQFGELQFGLEFYTDVADLSYLLPQIREQANTAHPLAQRWAKLSSAMADLVESYNLVSFVPFDVNNQELLQQTLKLVDKANGFVYVAPSSEQTGQGAAGSTTQGLTAAQRDAQAKQHNARLMGMSHKTHEDDIQIPDIQERYMPRTTQPVLPPARAPQAAEPES